MKRNTVLLIAIMLASSACGSSGADPAAGTPDAVDPAPSTTAGGGDGESPTSNDGNSGGGGRVVNPQPPGQAMVSVDGLELTFEEPGTTPCNVTDGEFAFSFVAGESIVGGGGVYFGSATGWGGGINLSVANPENGEPGPIKYRTALPMVDASTLAFDGSSMSYSGPMSKQGPGSEPAGEEVTGTVSVTCS